MQTPAAPRNIQPVGLAGIVLFRKVHPQAGLHGGGRDLQDPGGRVQAFAQLGDPRNGLQSQSISPTVLQEFTFAECSVPVSLFQN